MGGWLSWPCWLTDSGRLNQKVVTHPASSLAQDRESSPAETSVLTTMLRRQLKLRLHLPVVAVLLQKIAAWKRCLVSAQSITGNNCILISLNFTALSCKRMNVTDKTDAYRSHSFADMDSGASLAASF